MRALISFIQPFNCSTSFYFPSFITGSPGLNIHPYPRIHLAAQKRSPCLSPSNLHAGLSQTPQSCASDPALRDKIHEQTVDWGTQLTVPTPEQPVKILHQDPLLLLLPSFLIQTEITQLINAQSSNTEEASLYLNYRVNSEVSNESHSNEAAALIAETTMANNALRADMRSGFRAQVPFGHPVLQPVLQKVAHALGFSKPSRRWVYNDGPWVRPNRRQVILRDVTTVHYDVEEGVAPHIDGKDITVLIGLQPARKGGRTVFVDENIAVRLNPGDALVYSSKSHMLHYAEPVEEGEKWVLQLLIDCRVRKDELDVDYETGLVS